MDSLLKKIDENDDVKGALGNISDETIDKVYAGKVTLIRSYCIV